MGHVQEKRSYEFCLLVFLQFMQNSSWYFNRLKSENLRTNTWSFSLQNWTLTILLPSCSFILLLSGQTVFFQSITFPKCFANLSSPKQWQSCYCWRWGKSPRSAVRPFKGGAAAFIPVVLPFGEQEKVSKCCLKAIQCFWTAVEHHIRPRQVGVADHEDTVPQSAQLLSRYSCFFYPSFLCLLGSVDLYLFQKNGNHEWLHLSIFQLF